MVYIGIDSSLSCTAVGVITRDGSGKAKLLSFTKIPTDPKDSYLDRCSIIIDGIKKAIDPYVVSAQKTKSIVVIGIETPNSFRGGDVTRKLCGLYGMILFFIKNQYGTTPKEINTKHAKKVSTGNGSAKKDKIVKSINKLFSLSLRFSNTKNKSDDDVADALSIAYCMLLEDSLRKKVIKKRRKR